MHASSFIALALGATAVSAAAVAVDATPVSSAPVLSSERRQNACDPYCQFPKSLDCPGSGGVHIEQKDLIAAVVAGDRSQPPRETSAANLATRHCGELKTFPLWIVRFSLKRND